MRITRYYHFSCIQWFIRFLQDRYCSVSCTVTIYDVVCDFVLRLVVESDGALVDARCRSLTASWARSRAMLGGTSSSVQYTSTSSTSYRVGMDVDDDSREDPTLAPASGLLCNFYEEFDRSGREAAPPTGAFVDE